MGQKREEPGPPPRRRRRTAEVARREILDAARKRLMEGGPDRVRLKQIGEDVGLSHSSILHHFGSRDGLMEALRSDAFGALARDLAARMATPAEGDAAIDFFEKIARTLGEEGYGRLLAWQMMSGGSPGAGDRAVTGPDGSGGLLDGLAGQLLKNRAARAAAAGEPEPEPEAEETRRIVAMMACTLLGEALAGHVIVRSAGLGSEPEDRRALRAWIAKLAERETFATGPDDEKPRSPDVHPEDVAQAEAGPPSRAPHRDEG